MLVVSGGWRLVWVLVGWRCAGGTVLLVRRVADVPEWSDRRRVADRLEVWADGVNDPGLWVDVMVAASWLRDWRRGPPGGGGAGRVS